MFIVIVHLNSTAHSVRTLYFDIVRGRVSHESFRLVLSVNVWYIRDVRGGFLRVFRLVCSFTSWTFSTSGEVFLRVIRLVCTFKSWTFSSSGEFSYESSASVLIEQCLITFSTSCSVPRVTTYCAQCMTSCHVFQDSVTILSSCLVGLLYVTYQYCVPTNLIRL